MRYDVLTSAGRIAWDISDDLSVERQQALIELLELFAQGINGAFSEEGFLDHRLKMLTWSMGTGVSMNRLPLVKESEVPQEPAVVGRPRSRFSPFRR